MKESLREDARRLRREGLSIKKIAAILGSAQSSASVWCKGVTLTAEQQVALSPRNVCQRAREMGNLTNIKRCKERWDRYRREAILAWKQLSNDPLFMFGLALYVGEGDKTSNHECGVSNCDTRVLTAVVRFFGLVGVPTDRIRVQIHLHDTGDSERAVSYWSQELGLSRNQFTKVICATSTASKKIKGNIQPNGTCHLRVYSTELKQKINTWMFLALAPIV